MKVFTAGTFDLLHWGHVNFLNQCKKIAGQDNVIVSLNTDEFIAEYKGKAPIMSYEQRKKMLEGLCSVDEVVQNEGGADAKVSIEQVRPDAIVIGSDWAKKDYYKQMDFTQEWLDEKGILLIYVPYTEGVSTTQIKQRVKQGPLFTAVVIAHENVIQMGECIDMIQKQTYKNVAILVIHSDMPNFAEIDEVVYVDLVNGNDWGQAKAAYGLDSAVGKYVGFFNIDDQYEPDYIEKMVRKAEEENFDLVYCDYVSKEGDIIVGEPKINKGTRGMFIVKRSFARHVGYRHRDYGADGKFLEELVEAGASHARLEEVLYVHK